MRVFIFVYNKIMLDKNTNTKIMLFGTFDGLRFLSKNPFLIVSIARDKNVFKIKKNFPDLNEKQRLNLLKKSKLVDRVVLGGVDKYLDHIIKEKPDIIALGYDQKAYVENLEKDLKNKGFSVKIKRLKPYKEKIYKNHLLKNKR